MKDLTKEQKKIMNEGLEVASDFFSNDPIKVAQIASALEILRDDEKAAALPEVNLFLCNLHLLSIAETGFDLNKKPYFSIYPGLPARYVVFVKTEQGTETIMSIKNRHPGLVTEFTR